MSLRRESVSSEKPRSRFERFASKIPLFLSYGILIATWVAFTYVISIHEFFIRRHETWHFVERLVLFHGLIGLTLLSLLIASTRSPTRPDQSLAPASANPTSVPAERAEDADDDDVPLRYLRNSQWVTSRVSKDRPSPLPLTSRPRSSSPPSADSDRSTFGISAISPFPFAASPFVPASTEAAGEDEDEAIDEEKEDLRLEGETEGMEGDVDTDRLLPPRKAGRRKVSQQEACFAKSNTGGPRWCKKCDGWKPDRCHHCRWCQRCVLKMDHHCVWLGSCVGHHNYKPFLLFVTYGTLLSVYTTLEAGYESLRFFQEPDAFISSAQPPPQYTNGTLACQEGQICGDTASADPEVIQLDFAPVVFMLLAILGVFFTLSMGSLAGYHLWLASHNMTTLENITHSYPSALLPDNALQSTREWKPDHMLTRSERFRLRNEASEINVYDLGWRRNVRDILVGPRGSLWRAFWPLANARSRDDAQAGHFFEYDAAALEKLRGLTYELRLMTTRGETEDEDESEGDDDEDEIADDEIGEGECDEYHAVGDMKK